MKQLVVILLLIPAGCNTGYLKESSPYQKQSSPEIVQVCDGTGCESVYIHQLTDTTTQICYVQTGACDVVNTFTHGNTQTTQICSLNDGKCKTLIRH